MSRHELLALLCGVFCGCLASSDVRAEPPRAAAEETREFEVLVRDKPVGHNRIRIRDLEDGTTEAAMDLDVSMSVVVYTYRYEFHGRETWQQDRLLSVDNRATDGGKALSLRARVDAQRSLIEIKDAPAVAGPAVLMTTNYWRLPPAPQGKFSILESDNGKIYVVELQRVGPDEIVVQNQKLPCTRYRLTGDAAADLWFDARNRLVRQQTVEQGHATELRLTRLVYNTVTTARR
jgi:hypothetical protein